MWPEVLARAMCSWLEPALTPAETTCRFLIRKFFRAWICLCVGPQDCNSRRLRDFFIPNYGRSTPIPTTTSVNQRDFEFLYNTNDHGVSPAATLDQNSGSTLAPIATIGTAPGRQFIPGPLSQRRVPTAGSDRKSLSECIPRTPRPNFAPGYTVQKTATGAVQLGHSSVNCPADSSPM